MNASGGTPRKRDGSAHACDQKGIGILNEFEITHRTKSRLHTCCRTRISEKILHAVEIPNEFATFCSTRNASNLNPRQPSSKLYSLPTTHQSTRHPSSLLYPLDPVVASHLTNQSSKPGTVNWTLKSSSPNLLSLRGSFRDEFASALQAERIQKREAHHTM